MLHVCPEQIAILHYMPEYYDNNCTSEEKVQAPYHVIGLYHRISAVFDVIKPHLLISKLCPLRDCACPMPFRPFSPLKVIWCLGACSFCTSLTFLNYALLIF